MGITDNPTTLAALLGASGSLSSAFAPTPFQPKQSFLGTAVDPIKMGSQANTNLQSVFNELAPRLAAPVSFPDAVVPGMPSGYGFATPHPLAVATPFAPPANIQAANNEPTGSPTTSNAWLKDLALLAAGTGGGAALSKSLGGSGLKTPGLPSGGAPAASPGISDSTGSLNMPPIDPGIFNGPQQPSDPGTFVGPQQPVTNAGPGPDQNGAPSFTIDPNAQFGTDPNGLAGGSGDTSSSDPGMPDFSDFTKTSSPQSMTGATPRSFTSSATSQTQQQGDPMKHALNLLMAAAQGTA